MIFFPRYYITITAGVMNAIEALKAQQPEKALEILTEALDRAEDMFADDGYGYDEAFLRAEEKEKEITGNGRGG